MGWLPVPDPVCFTIFGIDIQWYAVCICTGMLLGLFVIMKRGPKKGFSTDRLLDYFLWAAPAGIIGARVYYVIFEWDRYKDDLIQVFNFRGGGLAIHGTIIAVAIVLVIASNHYKDDLFLLLDLVAVEFPLAQAIGRWGNYFNSEAHGCTTDLPWAIYADGEWVHPTFLYESIWCLLLFFFLLWWDKSGRTKFNGQITCLYMILYSLERFFVEALRTDSLYIGPFRQARVLSAAVIIGAVILYIILDKKSQNEEQAYD